MTVLKEKFERYNGDRLIAWLNENRGTDFRYKGRADVAPDLVYVWGRNRLHIEVTAAYYDSSHAQFIWDGARNADDRSRGWVGVDPDTNLASEISERIRAKSSKDYGRGCLLLVVVPPGLTSYATLLNLLSALAIGVVPFDGIYVAGTFPKINLDRATGGYRVISIKEWDTTYVTNGS